MGFSFETGSHVLQAHTVAPDNLGPQSIAFSSAGTYVLTYLYLMCTSGFAYMYVYTVHACLVHKEIRRGHRYPETEVTGGC